MEKFNRTIHYTTQPHRWHGWAVTWCVYMLCNCDQWNDVTIYNYVNRVPIRIEIYTQKTLNDNSWCFITSQFNGVFNGYPSVINIYCYTVKVIVHCMVWCIGKWQHTNMPVNGFFVTYTEYMHTFNIHFICLYMCWIMLNCVLTDPIFLSNVRYSVSAVAANDLRCKQQDIKALAAATCLSKYSYSCKRQGLSMSWNMRPLNTMRYNDGYCEAISWLC